MGLIGSLFSTFTSLHSVKYLNHYKYFLRENVMKKMKLAFLATLISATSTMVLADTSSDIAYLKRWAENNERLAQTGITNANEAFNVARTAVQLIESVDGSVTISRPFNGNDIDLSVKDKTDIISTSQQLKVARQDDTFLLSVDNVASQSELTKTDSTAQKALSEANKKVTITSDDNSVNITKSTNASGGVNYNLVVKNSNSFVKPIQNQIDSLNSHLDKNRKRADAGAASAHAAVAIPQVISAGKSTIGVGVGGYRNQNAIAVGWSSASDNGNHLMKTHISIDTQKKVGYGSGYSYQF